MPISPMNIVSLFPVRKSTVQKLAFRDTVQRHAEQMGYTVSVESGRSGCKNLIIGDPVNAKYLIAAHYDTAAELPVANRLYADNPLMHVLWQFYMAFAVLLIPLICALLGTQIASILYMQFNPMLNTNHMTGLAAIVFLVLFTVFYCISCLMTIYGPANRNNANDNTSGVLTLLEILDSIPQNQRHKVCFVLFDQNKRGMKGSAAYRKAHQKEIQEQLVLNLCCVGNGEHILMSPNGKLKDRTKLAPLYKCCGYFDNRSILVKEKGSLPYPADHNRFPYGINISAYQKGKSGHYIDRLHTSKDTVLDITNVNLLRAALVSMICCDAAQ